jgi:hypothetical protein
LNRSLTFSRQISSIFFSPIYLDVLFREIVQKKYISAKKSAFSCFLSHFYHFFPYFCTALSIFYVYYVYVFHKVRFIMRKMLLLPLIAVAVMASQAWAEDCKNSSGQPLFCQWERDGKCFSINNTYDPNIGKDCSTLIANCTKDGSEFIGVPSSALNANNGWGETVKCGEAGGTWTGNGKNWNAASLGYCDWGPCDFDPDNDYGCLPGGGCFEIPSEADLAECTAYGNVLTSKADCPRSSLPKADGGTGSPIISGASVAGLTVLAQNGSLHISSQKDADVSLFDMSGKQVFSQNVAKGYNTLSLNGYKQGVYFAVVSSGSSKQTVKVILK